MTDNRFDPFPPAEASPTPDPVVVAQWASFGRHALTYAGAALSAFGLALPTWLSGLTDPQLNMIASALVFFAGAGLTAWGFLKGQWDKWRARQAVVAAAVASANATDRAGRPTPVTVTVTPEGQDNEAVRVSTAEQRAAPAVPVGVAPSPAPRAA